jgi:hypothetical protein
MPKITEMFAFVVADKGPDDEGVLGMLMPDGAWSPLIGADMDRVKDLIPFADEISKLTGKPYKIFRFELKGELHESRYKGRDH